MAGITYLQRDTRIITVTIASGANVSDEFDMRGYSMVGIQFPAMTACSVGLQVSEASGGTFLKLYDDDGNLLQVDTVTGTEARQAPDGWAGVHYAKLWSQDGSGNNTAQGAARTIVVTLKG